MSKTVQLGRFSATMLVLLSIGLLGLNILLCLQNYRLRHELLRRSERPAELTPGVMVPDLDGLDVDGRQLTITFGKDERKTLLFIFSPECQVCEENSVRWDQLIAKLGPRRFRLIGVSLWGAGTGEFVLKHHLDALQVLQRIEEEDRRSYKLSQVPQLVLVGQYGEVEKVWTGMLAQEEWLELHKSLGLDAPALSD